MYDVCEYSDNILSCVMRGIFMLVVPYLRVCMVDTYFGCCMDIQVEYSNILCFPEGQAGFVRCMCDEIIRHIYPVDTRLACVCIFIWNI